MMTPEKPKKRLFSHIEVGLVLIAVVFRVMLVFTTHATEEDFYITLRHAENLVAGHGLVFNVGERTLGTTTPLYALLLAMFHLLRLDPVLCGKLVGIAAEAGSCVLLVRVGRHFGRNRAGVLAGFCLAIAPVNLIESVKGMEVSLVAFAVLATWTAYIERRDNLAWVCCSAVALLRPDGLMVAVLLGLACTLRDRRLAWRGFAAFVLLVGAWYVFATAYYGSPLPTTLEAKMVVYGWHKRELFPNLLPFLQLMTRNPLSLGLFLGFLLFLYQSLRAILSKSNPPNAVITKSLAPATLWVLFHYTAMAFSKVFLFGWYFHPPTPIYYLGAMLGWGLTFENQIVSLWRRLTSKPMLSLLITRALIPMMALIIFLRVQATLRDSQRVETTLRIPIGLWLRENASPNDRVMLEPIGYIGYFSRLRVLDTVGLVSPEVLSAYQKEEPAPYHRIWTKYKPEWILLRTGEWHALRDYEGKLPSGERLEATYTLKKSWQSPNTATNSEPAFFLFRRNL